MEYFMSGFIKNGSKNFRILELFFAKTFKVSLNFLFILINQLF